MINGIKKPPQSSSSSIVFQDLSNIDLTLSDFDETLNYDDENLILYPTINLTLEEIRFVNSIEIEDLEQNFNKVSSLRVLSNVYRSIRDLVVTRDGSVSFKDIFRRVSADLHVDRHECASAIEALHFDGSIVSFQRDSVTSFSIKSPDFQFDATVTRIISSLLTAAIDTMYINVNGSHSKYNRKIYSFGELKSIFVKANRIWPLIIVTEEELMRWMRPLFDSHLLHRFDGDGRFFQITPKFFVRSQVSRLIAIDNWSTPNGDARDTTIKSVPVVRKANVARFQPMQSENADIVSPRSSRADLPCKLSERIPETDPGAVPKERIPLNLHVKSNSTSHCSVCKSGFSEQNPMVLCECGKISGHAKCGKFLMCSSIAKICVNCCKFRTTRTNEEQILFCDHCIILYIRDNTLSLCESCKNNENALAIMKMIINDFYNTKYHQNPLGVKRRYEICDEKKENVSFLDMLNEGEDNSSSSASHDKPKFSGDWIVNDAYSWRLNRSVPKKIKEQEIDV